jgi:hypothetical protein
MPDGDHILRARSDELYTRIGRKKRLPLTRPVPNSVRHRPNLCLDKERCWRRNRVQTASRNFEPEVLVTEQITP